MKITAPKLDSRPGDPGSAHRRDQVHRQGGGELDRRRRPHRQPPRRQRNGAPRPPGRSWRATRRKPRERVGREEARTEFATIGLTPGRPQRGVPWSECSNPLDRLSRDVGEQVEALAVRQDAQLSQLGSSDDERVRDRCGTMLTARCDLSCKAVATACFGDVSAGSPPWSAKETTGAGLLPDDHRAPDGEGRSPSPS